MNFRSIHPEFDDYYSSIVKSMKSKGFEPLASVPLTKCPLNPQTGRFEPIMVMRPFDLRRSIVNAWRNDYPDKDVVVRLRAFRNSGGVFVIPFLKIVTSIHS